MEYLFRASGAFSALLVRQKRVQKPLVEGKLAPVVGDAQHVVDMRLHVTLAYFVRPLRQFFEHFALKLAGLEHLCVVIGLRHGEV